MDDLLFVRESINYKRAKATIAEISEIVGQWKRFADNVRVDPKLRDGINTTLIRF